MIVGVDNGDIGGVSPIFFFDAIVNVVPIEDISLCW